MKYFNLPKFVGASIVAGGLALMLSTSPATAQTSPDSNIVAQTNTPLNQQGDRNFDFDWGLLGLIGLAGLAGLRKQEHTSREYRS